MKNKLASCLVFLFVILFANAEAQKGVPVYTQVARNNCGVVGADPFLVKGSSYKLPLGFTGSEAVQTCSFGSEVVYAFDKVDIQAEYQMEVAFLGDQNRRILISADGNPVCEAIEVPAGKEIRQKIQLPRKAYAYGQLVLVFETLKGSNTIVSELNISSTNPQPLVPFEGDRKEALEKMQTYQVDTNVDAEKVLPVYAPVPVFLTGVYQPVVSLDGLWEFSEKDSGDEWKPIQVPGEWSLQGFKVDSAGWGRYRTSFRLPQDWKDKQVKLRFDGVHSEYYVYLNGKEVGYHLGGMTAYEMNITTALRDGANQLLLKVRSESLADMLGSLTQYAAHQLGGIIRKVTLFAVPGVHISDLRMVTELDKDYTDAVLKVYASVANLTDTKAENVAIHLSLNKHSAAVIGKLPVLSPGQTWNGCIEMEVDHPMLWDNEHPNLYTLCSELYVGGSMTEKLRKRIGFREIEVQGNRLLVNGVPVKLRGVCRHEAHPLTGRVLTTEQRRQDAELYRAANCNFIRTSHYPPGEEFLDFCDELGLFVELEAPVCWLGHHANLNWTVLSYRDPKYYPYVLQANMETVQFYRNHPSILFWSIANESYWNREFAQVTEYLKKADATRPFAFHDQGYGGFNNQGSTAPVSNIHYPGPNGYKEAAKSKRPMVYGEYCHLNVYNRSELVTDPGVRSDWALALAPAWENMYRTDGVLGGSIWSGIDDIFLLPGGKAVGYGAWGPIDGWRRPKPEYWDMKKIYSPVRVTTQSLDPANTLRVEVENRYTFSNLNEVKLFWRYGSEQGMTFTDIAPGKKGEISFAIREPSQANELHLSFVDRQGYTVDAYVIPVGKQVQNELPEWESVATSLKEQKDRYIVGGKDFTCEIGKGNGQIISLKRNKQQVVCGGPHLMALPLNGGGCFPDHNANTPLFNDLCSDWQVTKTSARREGKQVVIKVEGSYKEFEGEYTFSINGNGELSVAYSFSALQEVNPRQWGMVFESPVGFDRLFWRRDGLWSVYPDDHISRPVGEASLFYDIVPENYDPYSEPSWAWSWDQNELGSNDFRSTRRNIRYAGLSDREGRKVTVLSNGEQHWRSWLNKDRICFLVADFVTAGNEMFLGSYYAPFRKPIKKGDVISGVSKLRTE